MSASAAPSTVRIHLYMGPHKGTCGSAVTCAVSRLQNRFDDGHSLEIESKYIDEVRKGTPTDLIDWLLDSDIHIIATHVHQGIPRWSASIVYTELQRLRNHCGFPSGDQLQCPVFTQHKFNYLYGIRQFVAPTLAVQFPLVERSVDDSGNERLSCEVDASHFGDDRVVNRFLDENNEGTGWVVKLPFITHCEGMRFCRTKDVVFSTLANKTLAFGWRIPYALVQPRLLNRYGNLESPLHLTDE